MISPETAIFTALAAIFGAALFSFLLPKVADHFKEMNYRLLKELIDIRDAEGTTEEEKARLNKIISIRRESYLEKQEIIFDEFYNDCRIEVLKKSNKTHENLSELASREKTAKYHGHRFYLNSWGMLAVIVLAGIGLVSIAWWIAGRLIEIF